MVLPIIIILIWIVGAYVLYQKVFSTWTDRTMFDRVWFSVLWPLTGIAMGMGALYKFIIEHI